MEKKIVLTIVLLVSIFHIDYSFSQTFDLDWSTYFGDESVKISANVIDSHGNIYFAGRLNSSSNFEATSNGFQPIYGGGDYDGFLAKMSSGGQLLWSTYIGGENADYVSGLTIDQNNNIYLIGLTSSDTGIATADSYQPQKEGNLNVFISKFTSEGTQIWSTYYPSSNSGNISGSEVIRNAGFDIVADKKGYIYFFINTDEEDIATSGTFQTQKGEGFNYLISKFSTDGSRIWATYYGINKSSIYSIEVGHNGVYVAGTTLDCPPNGSPNTYFGTEGSQQPNPGSCKDIFLSKFSLDGQRDWSTYYGNFVPERITRKALLTDGNFIYLSGVSMYQENITTSGSYQEDTENAFTSFLVKFNDIGERQWGTYIGQTTAFRNLQGWPNPSLNKDSEGNIFLYGTTIFLENITTSTAFQSEIDDNNSTFLTIFNPEGELKYGTYFGGSGNEYSASPLVYEDNFYLFGETSSQEGISTPESYQPNFIENSNTDSETNVFVAKFKPFDLGVEYLDKAKVTAFPNPSHGNFILKTLQNNIKNVIIYSVLGQPLQEIVPKKNTNEIYIHNLATGLYLVSIVLENKNKKTLKIVVK